MGEKKNNPNPRILKKALEDRLTDTVSGRAAVFHPHLKSAFRGGGGSLRASSARLPQAHLEEAIGLALAIHLDIQVSEVVILSATRPATLFGSGTVERLERLIKHHDIDVAIIDADLTPVQQRNLERAWNCKVVDRTGLILEIFGERAQTRAGTLQVELAALSYARSRLVRSWTHLERQRGGLGFVGGPGETQIETDRRLIDNKITRLKRDLAAVKRTRDLHRKARKKVPYPVVALVGYTNAGKSTLFNRLTKAEVMAEDQLFATLDPTMRKLNLPSGQAAILSDTVGFVSDLPHELVEAFHATLEEIKEADVIVHVRDAAHPDTDSQKKDVEDVLRSLGLEEAADGDLIEVLNKTDLLNKEDCATLTKQSENPEHDRVALSALSGKGADALLNHIDARLRAGTELIEVDVDPADGRLISWLYDHGEVVGRADDDMAVHLSVRLNAANMARFRERRPA